MIDVDFIFSCLIMYHLLNIQNGTNSPIKYPVL